MFGKKRRKSFFFDDDFFDIIKDLDEEIQEKLYEGFFKEFEEIEPRTTFEKKFKYVEQKSGEKPIIYGFTIKIGPDGKPVFQRFGNIKPEKKQIKEEVEPLVDVFQKGKEVTILAQLPGVDEKSIQLNLSSDQKTLVLKVPKKYYKKVVLPVKVKQEPKRKEYRNGVLEIVFESA
ncbi:MAG: Hsp20/alpha crystallin family protein [archaeon]